MNRPIHVSTKTYGHDVGLSCCFRQWRADSHCSLLHGYAIAVHLEFSANRLDERNWVIDFGGLDAVKKMLKDTFDHKLLVAEDDPQLDEICQLQALGIAEVITMPNVGCEAFAAYIYKWVEEWLVENDHARRVKLDLVEVREHGANSAKYME